MFAVAVAFLPVGGVAAVASLSSLTALLAFMVVNASVVILRFRERDASRPFRVPLTLRRVPIPAVVGDLASIVLATQLRLC